MIIVHHTNAICSFAGAKLKSAMLPHWRRPRSMLLVGNYQAWTGDLPETREEPVVHPAKDPRRLARARVRTGLAAGGRWIRTSGSARDRSRRAAVQKTLGVARQPFEAARQAAAGLHSAHNQSDMLDRMIQIFGVDKSAEITVNWSMRFGLGK